MKIIKLKSIELTNFKGIAHRIETFDDGENFIIGDNGTGKTSIFDAFTWLLFGKDSQGQAEAKAKIKMQDKDGNPIMHMDNVVEAVFDIDGEELKLKRTYCEVWRKPSGQSEQVYDGQTTKFEWNGNAKIGSTEYKKRVNELIDEGLFKLITDPLYFASLDVKERRKIVLAMAGEISDDAIRAANVDLTGFDPTKNVDEKRSVAVSTKNKLIKDRDNYPARIDEQMQTITRKQQELDALELPEREKLLAGKAQAEKGIAEIEEKMANVGSQVMAIAEKNNARLQLIKKAENYKIQKQNEANREVDVQNRMNALVRRTIDNFQADIATLDYRISNGKQEIANTNAKLTEYEASIKALKREEAPDFSVLKVCPTCNRPLDEETIESEKAKMLENWTLEQNKKINDLQEQGDALFEKGKNYKTAIDEIEKQKIEKQAELDELKSKVLDDKPYQVLDFTNDEEYQALLKSIPDEISAGDEIKNLNEQLINQKAYYKGLIDGFDHQLQMFTTVDILQKDIQTAKERIEKLKAEELNVNQGIANQERIIYLCDLWSKTKVNLLNNIVASKFNLVKFKMFNYTQEGNAVPTCEITVNGVDYTALNTAGKLNAGLDIINALIEYYNVKAPIFIDNRESVNEIVSPNTQIINLKVKQKENEEVPVIESKGDGLWNF